MRVISSRDLIELFPNYKKEIEELYGTLACGCSLCIWNVLEARHTELRGKLRDKFPEMPIHCGDYVDTGSYIDTGILFV